MFQYLYYHLLGFIDWFSSITPNLDKFKLFKSMIFNFFTVLFSFFLYINNIPFCASFDHFASDSLNIILSSHLSSIFLLHLCYFCCTQYQHHNLYVYFCWFSFFPLFQLILIYFNGFVCTSTDLSSIYCQHCMHMNT